MPEQLTRLSVGDRIPHFKLPDTDGSEAGPDQWVGHPLVLYFFCDGAEDGCASQIGGFRDLHSEFSRLGEEGKDIL